MLVVYLHIFVSCFGVHLHWQAFGVQSAFDVTFMMLFLCKIWGLSYTGQMCAVMIAGIFCISHALSALQPMIIDLHHLHGLSGEC